MAKSRLDKKERILKDKLSRVENILSDLKNNKKNTKLSKKLAQKVDFKIKKHEIYLDRVENKLKLFIRLKDLTNKKDLTMKALIEATNRRDQLMEGVAKLEIKLHKLLDTQNIIEYKLSILVYDPKVKNILPPINRTNIDRLHEAEMNRIEISELRSLIEVKLNNQIPLYAQMAKLGDELSMVDRKIKALLSSLK